MLEQPEQIYAVTSKDTPNPDLETQRTELEAFVVAKKKEAEMAKTEEELDRILAEIQSRTMEFTIKAKRLSRSVEFGKPQDAQRFFSNLSNQMDKSSKEYRGDCSKLWHWSINSAGTIIDMEYNSDITNQAVHTDLNIIFDSWIVTGTGMDALRKAVKGKNVLRSFIARKNGGSANWFIELEDDN